MRAERNESLRHAVKFAAVFAVMAGVVIEAFACSIVYAVVEKAENAAGIVDIVNAAGAWLFALAMLVSVSVVAVCGVMALVLRRRRRADDRAAHWNCTTIERINESGAMARREVK